MRRSTVHTIILGCYMVVLAVLAASLWLNDERLPGRHYRHDRSLGRERMTEPTTLHHATKENRND